MKTQFTLLFLFLFPLWLCAQDIDEALTVQDTSQHHLIVLKNGDQFVGTVIALDNQEVTLLFNERVELHFPLEEVRRISVLDKREMERDFEYREDLGFVRDHHKNINPQRFLLTPTAFPIKKGVVSYENLNIFGNTLDYGLSDRFTIGATAVPLIFVNSLALRLKYSQPVGDNVRLGLAVEGIGVLPFAPLSEALGATISTFSLGIGQPKQFFNANVGYFYGFSNFDSIGFPFANLGGGFMANDSWRISGDVFIPAFNTEGPLLVNMIASWIPNHNRLFFGFMALEAFDSFLPLPIFGYGVAF